MSSSDYHRDDEVPHDPSHTVLARSDRASDHGYDALSQDYLPLALPSPWYDDFIDVKSYDRVCSDRNPALSDDSQGQVLRGSQSRSHAQH